MLSRRAMTKTVDGTRCLWSHTDLDFESLLTDYHWARSWAFLAYNVQSEVLSPL